MSIREEVRRVVSVGRLPSVVGRMPPEKLRAMAPQLQRFQEALELVAPPVTVDEAVALTALFPEDDDTAFGLAWSLVHLIETCPSYQDALDRANPANPWVVELKERLERWKKGGTDSSRDGDDPAC